MIIIKTTKRARFHPLLRKHTSGKTTKEGGGVKMTPPNLLGLNVIYMAKIYSY